MLKFRTYECQSTKKLPKVTAFDYYGGFKLRTIMINGEPWFAATDAGKIFEFRNPTYAVTHFCKEGCTRLEEVPTRYEWSTMKLNFVSLSGLYAFVNGCDRSTHQKQTFWTWIASEVVPTLKGTKAPEKTVKPTVTKQKVMLKCDDGEYINPTYAKKLGVTPRITGGFGIYAVMSCEETPTFIKEGFFNRETAQKALDAIIAEYKL